MSTSAGPANRKPLFTFALITDTHIRPPGSDESSPFPVNDLANGRARFACAAVAAQQPVFTIHMGDMVHPLPHLPTYKAACEEAHAIFKPLASSLRFMPGNHDIGDKPMRSAPAGAVTDESTALYESIFGPSYHSFDHGGCHFTVINSSLINNGSAAEDAQAAWLAKDLNANAGKRLFLFTHYPPFINTTDEPVHYDNYDEPGRSWLLDLVARHNVEAVFSGHVHQFFYNRVGDTKFYCLPPTSFTRQDYAELYRVEPAKEYGRNDEGKFSYAFVDVFADGFALRVAPTEGAGLEPGQLLPASAAKDPRPAWNPLTLHLRHAWAEAVDLPYNGPMEEFSRKRARNDYTLLRLQQMGIWRVRTPLADLLDAATRKRMEDYAATCIRFTVFSLGVPSPEAQRTIADHADLLNALEIITDSADLADIKADLASMPLMAAMPVFVGKAHSSAHEPAKGSKFAHSVSFGFKWEERDAVLAVLQHISNAGPVQGIAFQINLSDDLAARLADIDAFAAANGLRAAANVRIAHENPAVPNFDDELIAARVAEAARLAASLERTSVQIDSFADVDRGYNPRHGLIDRRFNFRPAGRVLAGL